MGKNTIISQWIVRCLHIISNGKWNQITLTRVEGKKETRKCMLRPNSFSLLSAFLCMNQRIIGQIHSTAKCITLSHTLSSQFSRILFFLFPQHTCGLLFIYFVGWFLFTSSFPSFLPRILAFYFDFGTFEMFKWMKWKAEKKILQAHDAHKAKIEKKSEAETKKIWTLNFVCVRRIQKKFKVKLCCCHIRLTIVFFIFGGLLLPCQTQLIPFVYFLFFTFLFSFASKCYFIWW